MRQFIYFREKMREQEYNMKLQRIVTLEKELKTNLDGLKKKQSDIESREKELESRNIKIKEREERLKNLVEDEKQRSDRKIQITTKEFRTEIKELTNQNKALSEKLKNLEGYDQESKTIRKEHEKHQSLLKNEKDKTENSTRKISELDKFAIKTLGWHRKRVLEEVLWRRYSWKQETGCRSAPEME